MNWFKCIHAPALVLVAVCLTLAGTLAVAGSSASYSTTTTVLSGGGAESSSGSFIMNGTVGQPTPVMDPSDPPYSTRYDLYPGFWYTLEAGAPGCSGVGSFAATFGLEAGDPGYSQGCDMDGDGDVDGIDLAGLAQDS